MIKYLTLSFLLGCGQITDFDLSGEIVEFMPMQAACGNISARCGYANLFTMEATFMQTCDLTLNQRTDLDDIRCIATAKTCDEVRNCSYAVDLIKDYAN